VGKYVDTRVAAIAGARRAAKIYRIYRSRAESRLADARIPRNPRAGVDNIFP
jgi:hypothetical protein